MASFAGKEPGLKRLNIKANSNGLLTAGVADSNTILVSGLSLFSC